MSTLNFAETHNLVAFLNKPAESEGFEQIVDFLNAHPIRWQEVYPRFIQTFLDKQLDELPTHKEKYDASFHTKKVFANMRRIGKDFSGRVTPLFQTMVVQNQEQMGEGSTQATDTHPTPTFDTQPPQPKKTQKPRKTNRKTTKVPQRSGSTDIAVDEAVLKEGETATPNEPSSPGTSSGGGPRCQETMGDTPAHTRVLDLETELKETKSTHKAKVANLRKRVKKLEKKNSLDKEDASKQGRIADIDDNEEITLVSTIHDDVDEHVDDTVVDNIVEDVIEEEVVEDIITAKLIIDVSTTGDQEVSVVNVPVSATAPIITTAQPTEATKTVEITTAPKDKRKGKTIMIEEPKMPKKRKVQERLDKEYAEKLLAKIDEEG
ncbi:hypothetical protein Tco_1215328 [Tanacetum coccineum]